MTRLKQQGQILYSQNYLRFNK